MVAVILAITVSGWVNLMSWGSFVCLVVSAVLFWGVYGGVLLITREKFVNEIVGQMIKKNKKKLRHFSGKKNVNGILSVSI